MLYLVVKSEHQCILCLKFFHCQTYHLSFWGYINQFTMHSTFLKWFSWTMDNLPCTVHFAGKDTVEKFNSLGTQEILQMGRDLLWRGRLHEVGIHRLIQFWQYKQAYLRLSWSRSSSHCVRRDHVYPLVVPKQQTVIAHKISILMTFPIPSAWFFVQFQT